MGKLYVLEIDFRVFSDFNKNYDDYTNSNNITLLESIYDDIRTFERTPWFTGLSRIPETESSYSSKLKIVIDIDLLSQENLSLTYVISSLIIPSIKKKFSIYKAPYDVINNSDYPSVNTLSSGSNGGGYLFAIGLGYKPLSGSATASTPPTAVLPTTTTTTTTTSTTTTTTTINNANPTNPQETSRGEITEQNQSQSDQNSSKNNITSPGIVNVFPTTIRPNDIAIVTTNGAANQTTSEMANGMGYLPIVWYNSFQIDIENVQYLSLYDDGIATCMKLTFIDTMGLMKDKAFPLDDTKVTLFLNSRSDQLKPIFVQFKIKDFSNNNGVLTIDSIMDVNNLYVKKFQSYPNMTSNATLQQICKDVGLGFSTNIIDTNDSMTWLNTGQKPYDFMSDVVDHGYISDQSFLAGYIDPYYNFVYVDIQKELSRDISNELGIVSSGIADILKMADTNNSNIGKLLLTNDAAASGLNIYFNSFTIVNNSTSISLEHGYKDIVKFYDTSDKSLLQFDVNSLNNNSDKSIILKGATQDETFYKSNVNYKYIGKLDSDNMHKNYHYTSSNNNRNINDTQKIAMDVELTTPNYGIYRFQKIKVILSSNTPTPASPMINQRLSGDWLIIDIKFMYYDKTLRQVVSLVKRELELSDEELASEPQLIRSSAHTGDRGSNTNPSVETNPAGSAILGVVTQTTTSASSDITVVGARNYKTTNLLPATTWENISANFIAHKEGFEPVAKWDINHYRAGYGSDKKLSNGSLIEVTKGMTFTQLEAIETLAYEIKNIYGPKIANNIGQSNWNKLCRIMKSK